MDKNSGKLHIIPEQALLKPLHHRLTLLFTAATGAILIILSVCYIYLSEREWKETSYLSFLNESNTVLSNFEHQDTVTFRWLSTVAYQNHFLLAVYDNNILLSYTASTLDTEQKHLASSALSTAKKQFARQKPSSLEYSSSHVDFIQKDSGHNTYYTNVAQIKNTSSTLYAVILSSTKDTERKLYFQRIRFFFINIAALLLLLSFAYFYTGRLLIPIEENQKKQNTFLAATSHELRTPLAVILSSVSALETAETEKRTLLLGAIAQESKRMSTLINDMLLLARANNHTLHFQKEPCELDTLLLNSYEAFSSIAREKNMTFQIQLPEKSVPSLLCDGERIAQVTAILLSNAFSYGTPGGQVALTLVCHSSEFHIVVEDNGAGIPDDSKPHIFDLFYRGDSSRTSKEHFGLGLCIAKEIIAGHHGQILVTDTKGGGATFTVILPTT